MILDTTLRLEAVLAAAVAANQPEVHVTFVDYNQSGELTRPSITRTALNSGTDVTILAAPVANPARQIENITIYNKDTATVTCTIKTDDGTTERILVKHGILTLGSLVYERGVGWQVLP